VFSYHNLRIYGVQFTYLGLAQMVNDIV
jgi:hypothetical protein